MSNSRNSIWPFQPIDSNAEPLNQANFNTENLFAIINTTRVPSIIERPYSQNMQTNFNSSIFNSTKDNSIQIKNINYKTKSIVNMKTTTPIFLSKLLD